MANFSSIKFNGVDYPLKDASARDSIASLQTSVSGLDARVTALEQEVPEGVQTVTLPDEYDSGTGTDFAGLDTVDWEKPIFVKGRMTIDSGAVVMSQYIAVLGEPDGEYGYSFSLIDEGGNVRLFQQEFVGDDSVVSGEIANKVIANGQETPTAELTKLTVNNTTYSVPKKAVEVASFDALSSLVMEKGLELPVDKPYFFPNEFDYTYFIHGDSQDIEKTILVRKQEVFISISGDGDYVEASFTFFAFSNGVEGRYSALISNMGDISVGELYTIGVNKTGVNVSDSRELHSILVSDTLYTLPDPYYLQVVPQIVSEDIGETTCYGVWVSSLGSAKNSDIAKALYFNTMPVMVKHTVVDYEEFEHTYSIASGELYLEKVTKTITDAVSGKTFNGGYTIKFKKPKTSPEGTDSYYTAQELAAEHNYIAPYLVLDGTTPKIAFETVI